MNFSYLRREPGFYRRVFTLALPVVLQNLITTSLGFMDTFMVGLVGQEQMSAVTVANVPIYIIQLIVFGLQSGSRVLISQFWGRGDRESINRVMGIGFFVAGGISTLCALTMGLFPRQVLMLITDNARLVELGTSYIRIVGFSYILNSLSSIYIGMQQSIENPRFGMTVFAISTVCNTVGNYILIFGKLGLPALGITGAAIATLTARGIAKAEEFFSLENLSDPENSTIAHHINQAIKAHGTMKRDVDYVVKDGEIIIVDEFTGRLMFGRRYSEGLHQAIEAKEHVSVQRESKTLATITFQNYFRLYSKLSGMTGTAMTEEEEFATIYKLDIVEIPTNRPVVRIDNEDAVYKTEQGKYRAVIRQVKECHEKGQPVLVGTVSIEKNELLSRMLTKEGIRHNLLNAKNHEKEAEIVAQAGQFGAVTVATNMAGRGTDIMLGGNAEYMATNDLRKAGYTDEVIADATGYAETDNSEILEARQLFADKLRQHKAEISGEADRVRQAGGLFIIGTERHDSRRIDNQLRGRAGRQGDPGETRFYISLEDDLMRLFGGERVQAAMERMNIDEDMPIESKMLTRSIQQAQTTVESRNFQARKSVLEYDDVMNKQREIIYGQRRQVLEGMDVKDVIMNMMNTSITHLVQNAFSGVQHLDMTSCQELLRQVEGVYFPKYAVRFSQEQLDAMDAQAVTDAFTQAAAGYYQQKEDEFTAPVMREVERVVLLRVVDEYWMEHIDAMSDLRQGIRLRAYAQTDPIIAYKKESLEMFEEMIAAIQDETVRRLYSVRLKKNEEVKRERVANATSESVGGDGTVKKQPRKVKKIGRNEPCPCGSGKKYKNCCGRNA